MSLHNHRQRCTGDSICTCSQCCLCRECLFFRRSRKLYSGQQATFRQKKFKSGPKQGKVRKEKRDIPYTLEQFQAWLQVVLEDTPWCCYCRESVDILNISPDHEHAVSRGGSLELANLRNCCGICNRRKGKLSGKEFMFLRKCVETMPEAARGDIWKRLGGGIKFMGGGKPKAPSVTVKATNILAIPAPKDGELF